MFCTAYVLNSLKLFKLKTEGQAIKRKMSLKSCKTELEILANPGLV